MKLNTVEKIMVWMMYILVFASILLSMHKNMKIITFLDQYEIIVEE